jgi:hypothetical protein
VAKSSVTEIGYRPRYPEEDAKRSKMRRDAFNLVDEARKAREREEMAAARVG